MAGSTESAAGNGQDFLFLQQGTEGDIIFDWRSGKQVEGAFRFDELITGIFKDIAEQSLFSLYKWNCRP